jgi:hypothetical protein
MASVPLPARASKPTPGELAIQRVSAAAAAFEARWAYATLATHAPELHARFSEQRALFLGAVEKASSDLETQTQAMIRAYTAITRRMEEAGAADDAYLVATYQDMTVAIGRNRASEARVREVYGDKAMFLIPEEVAVLAVELGDVVKAVKEMWPGAEIVGVNKRTGEFAIEGESHDAEA